MKKMLNTIFAGLTLSAVVCFAPASFSQDAEPTDTEQEIGNSTTRPGDDSISKDTQEVETSQKDAVDTDRTDAIDTDKTDSVEHTASTETVDEQTEQAVKEEDIPTKEGTVTAAQEEVKEVVKEKRLAVASWGGAYMQAQNEAFLKTYKEAEDVKLTSEAHSGQYQTIKAKLSSPQWDVVDLTYDMVEQACAAGLLENIDTANLASAPNGSSAADDFFDGGLHKCGVASMVWSLVITYNKGSFKRRRTPQTAKDFFNTRRFRGKRALPKTAENVLELALLADGVKAGDVYSLLETPEGIDRAFKVLNRIKKNIVWWTSPSEPYEMLANRKASFALGYSGKAFSMIAEQKKPFGLIWDAQLYNYNLWAIPKNASNKETAQKFIAYATKPEKLAIQSSWFPYGPARRSAVDMIKLHPEADINMKPYIPTISGHFSTALRRDKSWWEANGQIVKARFSRWLAGEKEIFGSADVAFDHKALAENDTPRLPEPKEEAVSE